MNHKLRSLRKKDEELKVNKLCKIQKNAIFWTYIEEQRVVSAFTIRTTKENMQQEEPSKM